MMEVNFNHKVFRLLSNSTNGTSTGDTIFHYQQKDNVVTAEFSGGAVLCGNIIAIHQGNYLQMIYQMLTTIGELKSGQAFAKISVDNNDKILLELDWEWLQGSGNHGISTYIEL